MRLNAATGLSSIALIALTLMGYGFIAARQIQVEEIKITTPKLSPTDGRWLYVSRGTGTWGPPVRLFAAPEITLITIEHENN